MMDNKVLNSNPRITCSRLSCLLYLTESWLSDQAYQLQESRNWSSMECRWLLINYFIIHCILIRAYKFSRRIIPLVILYISTKNKIQTVRHRVYFK